MSLGAFLVSLFWFYWGFWRRSYHRHSPALFKLLYWRAIVSAELRIRTFFRLRRNSHRPPDATKQCCLGGVVWVSWQSRKISTVCPWMTLDAWRLVDKFRQLVVNPRVIRVVTYLCVWAAGRLHVRLAVCLACVNAAAVTVRTACATADVPDAEQTQIAPSNKKLSYRRGTARCVMSIEILPIATQQCRNYLYDKSWPNWWYEVGDLVGGNAR